MKNNDWERNYILKFHEDNIDEIFQQIERTINEAVDCNREIYKRKIYGVICGPAIIDINKIKLLGTDRCKYLSLCVGNKEIASIPVLDEDKRIAFEVSGVVICENGDADYQDADVIFYDCD